MEQVWGLMVKEAELEHLSFIDVQKPLEIWHWHLGKMGAEDSVLKVIWTRGLFLFNKLLLILL